MDGEGVIYFPYGGFMRGTFRRNKINGSGILKFPNGDIYKGIWKDGKLNGDCEKFFVENEARLICEYLGGIFQRYKFKGKGINDLSKEKSWKQIIIFCCFKDEHVEGELQKLEELERKHFLEVFF